MASVNDNNLPHVSDVARDGARSLFVMIGGSVVVQAVVLVAAIVIPRFLGPEVYGRWSAVMALVSFAAVVVQFSLVWVDLRYVGAPWRTGRIDEATEMASTTWSLRLVFGAVIAGVVAGWAYVSPALQIGAVLAITIFFLAAARYGFRTHQSLLMAMGLVGRFTAMSLARAILICVAVIGGYALADFLGILLALAIVQAVLFFTSLLLLRRVLPVRPSLFSWPLLRPHLGYASWTFVGSLCRSAQMWLSIYIVAMLVSSIEAAFVGVQIQAIAVLSELASSGRNALLPILAQFDADGQHSRMRNWGSMIVRYGIAAGCMSIVVWALLGQELTRWILSDAYAPVYEGVIWMATAHMFLFAALTCNAILNLRGLAKLSALNLACYALFTLGGVFWTVQTAGEGVAVRVAIVYAAAAGVFSLSAYVTLGVFGNCWLSLRRCLLLMMPSLLAWPAHAWDVSFAWRVVASVGFTIGYVALALCFGLIRLEEVRSLLQIIRNRSDGRECEVSTSE